jgi:hypothetical protein
LSRRLPLRSSLLVVFASAIMLSSGLMNPAHAATAGQDWFLLKAWSAETGLLRVELSGLGTVRHGEVLGIGFGASLNGHSSLSVTSEDLGARGLVVTLPFGQVAFTVTPRDATRFAWTVAGPLRMVAGDSASVIVFFSGATSTAKEATAADAGIRVQMRAGSGTSPLQPHTGDVMVSGPATYVGSESIKQREKVGLAGAFDWRCSVCVGDYRAPDGRAGSFFGFGIPQTIHEERSSEPPMFAGPPGDWQWAWAGAKVAEEPIVSGAMPVLGAFAPIGDDWVLYRSSM